MWNLNLGLDKVLLSFCGVFYIVICLTYVNYNKVVLSVHVDQLDLCTFLFYIVLSVNQQPPLYLFNTIYVVNSFLQVWNFLRRYIVSAFISSIRDGFNILYIKVQPQEKRDALYTELNISDIYNLIGCHYSNRGLIYKLIILL